MKKQPKAWERKGKKGKEKKEIVMSLFVEKLSVEYYGKKWKKKKIVVRHWYDVYDLFVYLFIDCDYQRYLKEWKNKGK